MTWPTKTDFVDGDVLTAAQVNNIGTNLNEADPTGITDGYVLTADGAGGMGWEQVAAGGWTLISSGSLSGSSVITFSSIPQTYKNLHLMVVNWGQATGSRLYAYFNNNTSANYFVSTRYFTANGTAQSDDNQSLTGYPAFTYSSTSAGSTGNFAHLMIPEYTKTTEKTASFTYVIANVVVGAGSPKVAGRGTLATSGYTNAVTRLDLYSTQTFSSGNYYLYGES